MTGQKNTKIALPILIIVLILNLLRNVDIRRQLDSAYVIGIKIHTDNVNKNRHILRRLIMCVKFCGAFELALRMTKKNILKIRGFFAD